MSVISLSCFLCFFFQAEDGIRDADVTGVQTCALPILLGIRAYHEAGGVMEEQNGGVALLAQLDELGGLGSPLGGDGPVVADVPIAFSWVMDKTTHLLVFHQRFKFSEPGSIVIRRCVFR